MVAVAPGHIFCNGVIFNTGGAITEIVIESFALHPKALLTVKTIVGLDGVKPNACVVFCNEDVYPSPKFQR